MTRRPALAAAGLVVALLASSCATPRSVDERQGSAIDVPLDDARIVALAGALVATARDRNSLVGSAHLSLRSPDLRFSRPQRMALERPARMRVEVLALFGQVAAILTTDGRRFQVYEPGESRVQDGLVSAGLLWEVARVDLEPEEAVGVLLGVPLQSGAELVGARQLEDGTLLLAYRPPLLESRRIFEFQPPAYLTRVRERDPDGSLVWEVAYTDYRELGERAFAHAVAIDFPRVDAAAEFQFEGVELNRVLPASAFELPALAR